MSGVHLYSKIELTQFNTIIIIIIIIVILIIIINIIIL